MPIPPFVTCDPVFDTQMNEEREVFRQLSMNTYHQPRDVFRPICNTNNTSHQLSQTSDQTMCNQSLLENSWVPPLYRNTSLLSSPSYDGEDTIAGGRQPHDNGTGCTTDQPESVDLPPDFIPPRHAFLKSEKDDITSQHGGDNESLPSSNNGRGVKILSSNAFGVHPKDIVCGRGAPSNCHPGNQVFRSIIKEHETKYLFARRSEKPIIAMDVLAKLRSRGMRFVRREKEGTFDRQVWVEISEQRAYEKVCQSLREGAPELRRRMLSTSAAQNKNDKKNDRKTGHTNYQSRVANTAPEETMTDKREKENYTPIPYAAGDLVTFV